MDLWIRSQDRELLLQTKIVELEYFGEDCFTSINTRYDGRNTSLGTYRKKERALEVLDEIQNILIDYKKTSRVVYQMPAE